MLRSLRTVVLAAVVAGATMVAAPATAAPDVDAPVVSQFDFTPKRVDLSTGPKEVTFTARVTDATGLSGDYILGHLSSLTTTQTQGFIWMDRISGSAQDGIYEGSIMLPDNIAPGAWSATVFPVGDTLGNRNSFSEHSQNLMVRYGDAVPNAPTNVKATTTAPGAAQVAWSAPTSDQPITGYTVTSTPGSVTKTVDGSTTTAKLDGLTNGTSYTFQVVATSSIGNSAPSAASNAVTPSTTPDAPIAVSAEPFNGAAQVTWQSASDGGSPITGFNVTVSPGDLVVPMPKNARSGRIEGLTNGVPYTFTVTATNANGESASSTASEPVTPAGPPNAVALPSAKVKKTTVTVTWAAPTTNGAPVTGYVVKWNGGSRQMASTQLSLKLQLKPGVYKITVTALSDAGSAAASPARTVKVKKPKK